MIPFNGYFKTTVISGGGFDTIGQPKAVTETVGVTVNCHIQTVTNNKQGKYEDGRFINSSFEIFIDYNKSFNAENIEIFKNEQSVGKFPIQSVEHLQLVGRTKITV